MGFEDIYVAYTYIYTHTSLNIWNIHILLYNNVYFYYNMCFTLDKNYMPRIF